MICPRGLEKGMEQDMEMESAICPRCEYEIDTDNFYDPAVLLGLIEDAKPEAWDSAYGDGMRQMACVVIAYLSGDPEPLKKLAGEK